MPEIWDRIKELADKVKMGYEKTSIINSEKRILNPEIVRKGVDFVQFSSNQIIPKWVFEGNADNSMVAYEFAKFLGLSEINYLIKEMEKSQNGIEKDTLNEITSRDLLRVTYSMQSPTDIFIPLKIFTAMSHDLYLKGLIKQDDFYQYLTLGNGKIKIHWSNKFIPFDKIYIVGVSGLMWRQKRVQDMFISREKDPEGIKLMTNENDILQISAKSIDNDSIQFLMRLVARLDIIDEEKVKVVNIADGLEDKK